MTEYAVVIEDAGSNYSAWVPDLPGCVAVGATVDEATSSIREAIQLHLASLLAHGDQIPPATSRAGTVRVA